jgi:hypothetical protein
MPPFAIKFEKTVYVVDPTQIRWMEYSERYQDLTLFYMNGGMETLNHPNIRKVYQDLLLQFNVLDVNKY